jgi:hypothetical protein
MAMYFNNAYSSQQHYMPPWFTSCAKHSLEARWAATNAKVGI